MSYTNDYFEDDFSLSDETLESPERYELIGKRVSAHVSALLRDGADPAEISYSFSYIATELGMRATNGSPRVLPTVLEGMTDATINALEHDLPHTRRH